MPEAPVELGHEAGVADIDSLYRPTHDEYARQRLIGVLRNHAFHNLREDVSKEYEDEGRAGAEGRRQAAAERWACHRQDHAAERPVPVLFRDPLQLAGDDVPVCAGAGRTRRGRTERGRQGDRGGKRPAGGTLRIPATFDVPRYVTAQDIHLAPGCFYSEYTTNDLVQGAMLAQGGRVGTGAMAHRRETGAVGQSVAHWLKAKYPDFQAAAASSISVRNRART